MKELQNFVYKYMDSLKHHKRYLAMLTALSMLVTFIVPLILMEPADSMTKQRLMLLSDTSNVAMVSNLNGGQDGNNGYSKGQLSEVTLLIGDGVDWAQGCLDADDVIEAAKREYFIGIASDFCVFLEGDLKPKGADAEGRVAVGGNIIFTGQYNYQIGNGDYTTGTPLKETDNYTGITNYAHVITDGYVINLNTLSQGKKDNNNYYYPLEGDFYKRFVIDGNIDDCKHYTWPNGSAQQVPYSTGCQHDNYNPNELAQFYQADLIDFETVFEWLKTQSQKLSNKTATGTSQVQGQVITFTGPGQNSDAVTIYFDLEQWDSNIREVKFVDVPENANLVVNCGGNIVKIGSEYSTVNFSTSINGEVISIIDSSGTEVNANNRKESEQILYNFYECGTDLTNLPTTDHGDEIVPYSLFVNTNFNGTILAPYAIVASDKECRGHLSGSLIAQKFTGGLEFGYRPYRGGTDILGSTAGYVVPFDKFVDDLNGNGNDNPRLAGATFEIKDEHENIVDTWTTTEETSYITFPTELDFAGGKNYTEDNKTVTHTYTISEKSAPEGYITTDKKYKIVITETVDLNYLLLVDNGTIPTRVTVNLDLYEIYGSSEVHKGTRTLYIRDGYDENQHIQRIITVENETDKEYFILSIENGNITKIEKVEDSSSFESLLQQADAEIISFNAVTPASIDILAEEAITVEPYPYAYTPENLLTDYNVVAFNELWQKSHVVGAMAAKYFMTADSYGDAAKQNSYFQYLGTKEPIDEYNSNPDSNLTYNIDGYYNNDYSSDAGGGYSIYCKEKGSYININNSSNLKFINNDYINFDTAKEALMNWSKNTAKNNAMTVSEQNLENGILKIVVNSDPSQNQNVVIPIDVFPKINQIRFVPSTGNVLDIEDLKKSGIVITFEGEIPNDQGQDNHNFNFSNYVCYQAGENNFQSLQNAFKSTNGKLNGNEQLNLYGSKLIWNFPDVVWNSENSTGKLMFTFLTGHVVAPQAYVLYNGGEGGVIAENVWVGSEIHYYPYYVNTNRTGDDVPEKENREEVNNGGGTGNESGGSTGGGTNDDETNDDETPDVIEPQFPPITDYSAIVTEITIIDKKTPQKLTNSNYYYDPTSLMIMPLPDETPSFTNEYALVFKKQSDESTALAGATIELQSGTISNGEFNLSTTHGVDSIPPWEWGNETNTYSIPLKKIQIKDLDADVVYRFYEAKAPDNYEIAKPIYFVKTDNKTIRYTDDETKLSDINSWTPIEFSESNKSSNIITMTDYKIYGPEIKLSKVQNGSSNPLQGAEFVLYAVGGDTLVYPLNDGTKLTSDANGEIDFIKVFKANPDNCNSEYIKNGYLVPGEYYLKETKAPDKYEVPTDNMYFIVNEDYTVEAEKVEKPKEIVYSLTNVPVGSDKQLNVNEIFDSNQSITKIEVIVDSVNGDSHEIQIKPDGRDIGLQFPLQSGTNIFDKVTHFADKDVYINTNGEISINAWNCSISEIKFYTTSSDTVKIPTEYTLNSEPVLSAGNAYEVGFNTEDNISGISTQSDAKTKTISVGSANANKTIEKIEFVISYVNGAGVQIKPNGNYDEQLVFSPNSVDTSNPYEYVPPKTIKLDSNGNIVITCWNIVIDEMRFYLEGMESTGNCQLTVSNVIAYYLDGTNATAESINALTKKDNIIGLEVTLGGAGSGNIQVNDAWKATGVTAGETITFGETNYTPPTQSTGSSTLISVKDGTTDTLLVGNNKAGATTNISVEKKWNDSENLNSIRPESITVQLKQDNSNFGEPVTLNSANGWKHTWTEIPRLKPDNETETYKYSVEEINVPTGYTVSYDNNDGIDSGQITITNTLKTTNIPVEKKWKNSDGSTATPNINQITVKLQKHNGSGYSDFLDKNGNPVTLVLSSNSNWSGEFTGIPEGQYQVVESVVPSGWTETRATENGKTIITNTQKAGALKLTKIWQNDTAGQRPEYINIKIYRTTIPPTNNNNNGSGGGTTGGDTDVNVMIPSATKSTKVTEDYARLLQYSLYFYDANMCGDEVTENSVYSWRNDCHTDDAVVGGFHDAGDHAMFGLPQGFTASTLGWTYNEYKTTFDSLGLTNHYKLIMKEFCDFFVKSTKMSNGSVSDLLLDKGNADTDHSYWGSPEAQSQGQRGGLVWANSDNSGGNIAAEYAAALASYYLNFPNDSNSSTYLEYAKALYNYSSVKTNPRSISGIYYDDNITDEQAWAAAWLYLATNEESYKNDCKNKLNSLSIPARGHFWGDPTLGAAIIYATRIEPDETTIENKISTYLNSTCSGDSFKVLDSWGSARHNTLLQLTAITYDKYQSTKSYSDWCKKQMAFLLGDNTINGNNNGVCFVTGFKDGDSDTNNDSYLPQHPHHRAASGYNDWNIFNDAKQNGTNTQYKYAHTLIGALVGGPNGNSYNDNIDDTVCNEVAIDYNAGLVGAAAALYSVYGTGHTVTEDVMVADGLEIKAGKTIYEEQAQAASVNIGELFSTSAMSFKRNAISVLADEPYVLYASQISNGVEFNLPTTLLNKSLEKIVLNFDASSGSFGVEAKDKNGKNITISPSDQKVTSNTMTINAVDGKFINGYSSSDYIKCNEISSMKINAWSGCNLVSVEFHLVQEGPSITINNAPTTALKIGATHTLTATGTENQIKWSSNSDKVIIGENTGELTVNGYPTNGKVTITATDSTDNTVSASIDITIEAMTLSLNPSSVVVGDKVNYSSNYDNAVIESGTGYSISGDTIIAESEGNHTVTAKAGNATATASLNVSALQISVNNKTDSATFAKDDTPTFTVNGQKDGHSFKWSSSNSEVLEIDETTGQAVALKSGQDIVITVVKDGNESYKDTITVNVTSNLRIEVSPTVIRPGKSAQLSAINADGDVTYTEESDYLTIEEIDDIKYAKASDSVPTETQITITGDDGYSNSTCQLTINPIGNPVITAPNGNTEEYILGIDQTLQLTASNILGTATWTSSNESVVAFEENVSGSNTIAIRSITNGESTITVTDTDGTTGTFKIFVKEIAVEPDIPEGLVMYKQVTLSAANLTQDGTWVITEYLPLTDENGDEYYYYIEEVTDNGVVQGSGGKYIPISYSDNGFMLDESTVKEVSVANKLTETIQGELPSTGGSGVRTYYYLGGVMMLLGIAGFTSLKRRERKRRKEE